VRPYVYASMVIFGGFTWGILSVQTDETKKNLGNLVRSIEMDETRKKLGSRTLNYAMGVADSLSDNDGHELPDLCLCCMLHNVFERRGGGNVICFNAICF
jgi:hypothetical protein